MIMSNMGLDAESLRHASIITIEKEIQVEFTNGKTETVDADNYKFPAIGEFVHLYKEDDLVASFKKLNVASIKVRYREED